MKGRHIEDVSLKVLQSLRADADVGIGGNYSKLMQILFSDAKPSDPKLSKIIKLIGEYAKSREEYGYWRGVIDGRLGLINDSAMARQYEADAKASGQMELEEVD
jgi:hypothetical protein